MAMSINPKRSEKVLGSRQAYRHLSAEWRDDWGPALRQPRRPACRDLRAKKGRGISRPPARNRLHGRLRLSLRRKQQSKRTNFVGGGCLPQPGGMFGVGRLFPPSVRYGEAPNLRQRGGGRWADGSQIGRVLLYKGIGGDGRQWADKTVRSNLPGYFKKDSESKGKGDCSPNPSQKGLSSFHRWPCKPLFSSTTPDWPIATLPLSNLPHL